MMLEQIIAEIGRRGWLVSNLFQLDDGSWRGNVRNAPSGVFHEFAEAPSATEALAEVLAKIPAPAVKAEDLLG